MNMFLHVVAVLSLAVGALAQTHSGQGGCGGQGGSGGSGGSGGGCGDLYGDLYVIARDVNGVPVPVIYTIDNITYIAYQPLDVNGAPIPLGPEGEVLDESALVEVEFGRCNSMRAPAKVSKMHFDAVIDAIKSASAVKSGKAGQLVLVIDGVDVTVDSPPQNLALYKHLMKKGHLQTNPNALDDSHGTHGEPVYRPALSEEDYAKFPNRLRHLLPRNGDNCWDANGNLDPACLLPEPVSNKDLHSAASVLAVGADKTARFTVDTIEYLNEIMGITGPIDLADPLDPTKTSFDYRPYAYQRTVEFDDDVEVLVMDGTDGWRPIDVDLLYWLHDVDPLPNYSVELTNVAAFVQRVNDAIRIIEFIHNYRPPTALWTKSLFDAPLRFQ